MNEVTRRTALITGANSGLGFEAAAQLADRDYRPVTITARTEAKVRGAQQALQALRGHKTRSALPGRHFVVPQPSAGPGPRHRLRSLTADGRLVSKHSHGRGRAGAQG